MAAAEVIAVDGGGSTCRLALDGPGGRLVAVAGAANVSSDFEGALSVLRDGLAELERRAGRGLADVPAYFALAGVIDGAVAGRVAAALARPVLAVEEDWGAALEGALGHRDGAVAGIGTGSFLARRAGKDRRALGGHGPVLGDEASGAWLGRGLLAAALRAEDGIGAHSAATRAALAARGGVAGTVDFAARARGADFAALAPGVADSAEAGDPQAAALMRAGAAYIAAALGALGWQTGEALCLTGGLAPRYARWLSADLAACLVTPAGSALDGAVARARDLAS